MIFLFLLTGMPSRWYEILLTGTTETYSHVEDKDKCPFDMLGYCTSSYGTCRLKWVMFEIFHGSVTQTALVDSLTWRRCWLQREFESKRAFQCPAVWSQIAIAHHSRSYLRCLGKTNKHAACANQINQGTCLCKGTPCMCLQMGADKSSISRRLKNNV